MSIVICKLPKAGLGNQLLPLMRAYTFGYLNKLPVTVIDYHFIKIGPWLRREKTKRNYKGFFTYQQNVFTAKIKKWKIRDEIKNAFVEPEIKALHDPHSSSFLFSEIPHYTHRFAGLMENRQLVIKLFYDLISTSIKNEVALMEGPCIGIHVRMGDYRKLKTGEEFGKLGTVRTPEGYFINIINSIRRLHGSELPVSVFSDGTKKELKQLFELSNVHLVECNNDLIDLLLLSKSKIIVTSAGSTFSYWAGFISDAPIIMHPTVLHHKIRVVNEAGKLYEGVLHEHNEQLIRQIRSII